MRRGERRSQEVSGSGVLINAEGEILSNWHVVDKATEVRCLLYDGRAFNARVLGSDKDTDVALLKLELPPGTEPLPYAELGQSVDLEEGDFVMAMGAPWGMSRSVSIGIVSCTRRYLPGASEYSIWLQTDAAISPGNSGGPLVDTAGRVVGLNTRGMVSGGDTGFTVPIEVARQVADHIRENGRMEWAWTGLQLQPLRDFNRNVYFPETEGVMIASTDPESPARRAGVQGGDRLTHVNDKPVLGLTEEDIPDLNRLLGLLPKNEPTEFTLMRRGERLNLEIVPREKGKVEGEQLDFPRWDFSVKAINQFDNPDLYFHRKEGVFVYGIKYPGNAATSGIASQDIVTAIDGKPITSLDDVRRIHEEALANLDKRHRLLFSLLRNGQFRQIVLDYSRDHSRN